jgi:hypothetical protein
MQRKKAKVGNYDFIGFLKDEKSKFFIYTDLR